MSDEEEIQEEKGSDVVALDDLENGEEGGGSNKGKRKLIIIIAAVLLVVLIGGGGAFFVMKGKGHDKPEAPEAAHDEPEKHGEAAEEKHGEAPKKEAAAVGEVYLDLEEFLVNLNSGSKQPSFLKMTITLELANQEVVPEIQAKLPRIRDTFQVYLRELRSDDLQGAAGMYRLREELLLRLNKVVYPAKVNDILFKEILVQ